VSNIDYTKASALPNDFIRKCGPKYDNEREIFKLAQMEVYNQRGTPCFYYAVDYNKKYNRIWGEDGDRLITHYFPNVMVYYQFQRDDKLWSKFGIEDMSTFSMYISKEHFKDITRLEYVLSTEDGFFLTTESDDLLLLEQSFLDFHIPQQGDLIQTEYNNYIYEVVERKETNGMYLLSKQYTWELIVRMFKVESNVKISTDVLDSPISKYINTKDVFDISSIVDSKKEDIIYKPKPGEKPVNNPFSNW